MNLNRVSVSLLLVAGATSALAQNTVSVMASGGSVAATNAPNGSTGYKGLSGTAATATIQYGSNSGNTQLKFAAGKNGDVKGTNLNGSTTNNGTTTTTNGSSNVGSGNGTTYYTAQWTSTAKNDSAQAASASGTYDPWHVTRGNLFTAGVYGTAGTKYLYYQAGLKGGTFDVDPGVQGSYGFSVGEAGTSFLDLTVYNNRAPVFTFNTLDNFEVYLLDPTVVHGVRESIDDRIKGGTLLTASNGRGVIQSFLDTYLQRTPDGGYDGSLGGYDLTLGIRYKVELPAYRPQDKDVSVVDWNTNTAVATSTPGPAAALPFALMALRRRRRA